MKNLLFFLLILFYVGCSNNPDYLIKKGQVGKVNNETLVKELDSLFLNDSIVKRIGEGDYMFSGDDKYLIFNSNKEYLLSLTPKQQHDINLCYIFQLFIFL